MKTEMTSALAPLIFSYLMEKVERRQLSVTWKSQVLPQVMPYEYEHLLGEVAFKKIESSFDNFLKFFVDFPLIKSLQEKIEYTFSKPEYLLLALTHKSFAHEWNFFELKDNERLEFLGDALLNTIVSCELFARFPELEEGGLSIFRSAIVNTDRLANWGKFLQLDQILLMGRGEVKEGSCFRSSPLAQAVESLVAAIYLDLQMDLVQAQKVINTMLLSWNNGGETKIFDKRLLEGFDVISKLQELMMANKTLPEYRLISTGPHEGPPFEVALFLRGSEVARVKEGSKKRANRKLAEMALEKIARGELC